jgi:hypothetical protein
VAPDLELVQRAVAAAAADPRLGRGPAIAEAARRFFLEAQGRGAVAVALKSTPAQVKQDLELFAAWLAAREAKAGVGGPEES